MEGQPKVSDAFDRWWAIYPHKVAKLAAQKAFTKAVKLATVDELIAGVERYKATKPREYAWAYPASWLNAGRWMDEVQPEPRVGVQPQYQGWECPHVERHFNRIECRNATVVGRPLKQESA